MQFGCRPRIYVARTAIVGLVPNVQDGSQAMIALFYPDYPGDEFYTIVAIFMRLGYFATRDPDDRFDFAVSWQDRTWVETEPVLEAIARAKPVLNLRCRDISKTRVERIFKEVFGRATFVDPKRHRGPCVKKFDENARGGSVVQGPVDEVEDGFVYQRLIDSARDGCMIEYRMPVVLNSLPVLYVQEKVVPDATIKTEKLGLAVGSVEDAFSADECAAILEFCGRMGLDFGELDVLRSNDDGQIYILDANKTPGGFGMLNRMKWRPEQRQTALKRLAAAFEAGIRARLGS